MKKLALSSLVLMALFGGSVFFPAVASPASTPMAQTPAARGPHILPFNSGGIRRSSAPAGARLVYNGGRVVSNVKVVEVIYGSGSYIPQTTSSGSPSISSFFTGVTNSPYFDWLTEYNTNLSSQNPRTNQTIGRGTFGGQFTITPSSANNGSTIQDSNIQAELQAQIGAGHLPQPVLDAAGNTNTLYEIFFRHGQSICMGASCSLVSGGFCAYHGTIAASTLPELYYSVEPDLAGVNGCGNGSDFQNTTSVASHEMIETVTDGEVGISINSTGPPLAWYDQTNGEIGDICNAQQGTITGGDGVVYTVQQQFSNVANNCIVSRTVATNDFSISANPLSVSVVQGGSGTSTISTATTSGSAQTVSLSVSGLPSGASGSFSPPSVTSGGSSTLTLSSGTAAAGTYSLTITGSGTSATHTASVSFTISTPTTNDFSISANPSSLSVVQGGSGTSTISTATTSGSAQTVSLSVSGLPSGASGSFSPPSVTSGGSSTLTLSSGTAAAGTYSLTITGSGTSATHTASVSFTISSSSGGGITNGGFESGLTGWTSSGASVSVVTSGCHGGTSCARLGSTSPTNGDSALAQTFAAPSGATGLSFWYKMTCPDTITYDWATVSLRDNTAGTNATPLAKTCTNNAWTQVSVSITAGHSYSLTLISHDDNYPADPSYTLYDDVTTASAGPPPPSGITNGGFESGLTGWTSSGASFSVVTSGCHGGTACARLGSTSPTNGDSALAQTFTAPAGSTKLTFWYKMTCPDTITYDWATVSLRDNTSGTNATPLAKTCTNNAWTQVSVSITAGHSYSLTLISHDDNYPADPSYTLYDDVVAS